MDEIDFAAQPHIMLKSSKTVEISMPGLKKVGKGPFRGTDPKGVFQTIDVGTAEGKWLAKQAKKFLQRKYLAVDPAYNERAWREHTEPEKRVEIIERLANSKVQFDEKKIADVLHEMNVKRQKARHINIDMPNPNLAAYDFPKIFRNAKQVLLPNGKIFITSENLDFIRQVEKLAKKAGLKPRWKKPIETSSRAGEKTHAMLAMNRNYKIHRLEITFGLKQAIPEKALRRKWPSS